MEKTGVSVIIPMKNVQNTIGKIISGILQNSADVDIQLILVDLNSTDNTLLYSLKSIHSNKADGLVVQCGNKTFGAALNTGISKAKNKYITFVFPRRMYAPFIAEYYKTAQEFNGDFIFGKFADKQEDKVINFSTGALKGIELFGGVLNGLVSFDIATIMVKKDFLIKNQIIFDEECVYGYAEEFIYKILLNSSNIYQSGCLMQREKSLDAELGLPDEIGLECFAKVQAMLRILELLEYKYKDKGKLIDKFKYDKIPATVMSCVDILLSEGYSFKNIKNILKMNGYDEYLSAAQPMSKKLKGKIITWNLFPKIYKA